MKKKHKHLTNRCISGCGVEKRSKMGSNAERMVLVMINRRMKKNRVSFGIRVKTF